MEETNRKNRGIDIRRAGGRPKLARYERRNHHHKVSYNDEEENIIQYKAEQAGIAHQANAGGFISVCFKAEQLIISLTELIRRILRGGDLSEPISTTDDRITH